MTIIGNEQPKSLGKKVDKGVIQYNTSFNLFSILKKIIKLLGKFFTSCIILVTIAHFVPELRENLPELFIFIEKVAFGLINWAYGIINFWLT